MLMQMCWGGRAWRCKIGTALHPRGSTAPISHLRPQTKAPGGGAGITQINCDLRWAQLRLRRKILARVVARSHTRAKTDAKKVSDCRNDFTARPGQTRPASHQVCASICLLLLRCLVARVVSRVDVVDCKRTNAVDLNERRGRRPSVVLHAFLSAEEAASSHELAFPQVELVARRDMERAR